MIKWNDVKLFVLDFDIIFNHTEKAHAVSWQMACKEVLNLEVTETFGYSLSNMSDDYAYDFLKLEAKDKGLPEDFSMADVRLCQLNHFTECLFQEGGPSTKYYALSMYLMRQNKDFAFSSRLPKENTDTLFTVVMGQDFLGKITSINEVRRGIPFGDLYLKIAKENEVEPQNILAVVNSFSALQMAKEAGCQVVLFSENPATKSEKQLKPEAIYSDLDAFLVDMADYDVNFWKKTSLDKVPTTKTKDDDEYIKKIGPGFAFLKKSMGLSKAEIIYLRTLYETPELCGELEDFVQNNMDEFNSLFSKSDSELNELKKGLEQKGLIYRFAKDNDRLSTRALKVIQCKYPDFFRLQKCLYKKSPKERSWNSFDFVEDREEICTYLKGVIENKLENVAVVFYGADGLGKKSFADTLIKHLGCTKIDVVYSEKIDELDLIVQSYKDPTIFVVQNVSPETIQDIQKRNIKTPIIYIVNDNHLYDDNFLGLPINEISKTICFDYPNNIKMSKIWKRELQKEKIKISDDELMVISRAEGVSLSIMQHAIEDIKLVKGGFNELVSHLNKILTSVNLPEINLNKLKKIPFDIGLITPDMDLVKFTKRICETGTVNFSLCLYGKPGTGKSAYAEWLAEQMGIRVIKKKYSDLASKYVGDIEKNIRHLFNEAKEKQAMLIFDEIDSLLHTREASTKSWEVSSVNEMLVQLENFKYPFVCTTNLMNRIDSASMRRFTFKIKFDSLSNEQKTRAFEKFFGFKNVNLDYYTDLTPGDFDLVRKKAEILDLLDNQEELIKMLGKEQEIKGSKNKIGF